MQITIDIVTYNLAPARLWDSKVTANCDKFATCRSLIRGLPRIVINVDEICHY